MPKRKRKKRKNKALPTSRQLWKKWNSPSAKPHRIAKRQQVLGRQAIIEDRPDLLGICLAMGMLPDEPFADGSYPMIMAIQLSRSTQIIEMMLAAGANINHVIKGGWTPLLIAITHNNLAAVEILLEHGADPNMHKSRHKLAPIHYAAIQGRAEIINLLLNYGCNPDVVDAENRSPLWFAKTHNHHHIIYDLLKSMIEYQNQCQCA